jgi:hypothetical protein
MKKFSFPTKARENLLIELIDDAEERAQEDDLKPFDAIAFLCMDTFGLGNEEGASRSDGKGDRGIDWFRVSKSSATIYQFKGPEDFRRANFNKTVNPSDLSDLRRILGYLQTISEKKSVQNRRVRKFQNSVNLRLSAAAETEEKIFYFVVNYFVSKENLGEQASDELTEINRIAQSITEIGSVLVDVKINLRLIDDVLEERWKQQNLHWKTLDGKNEEWITLEANDRGIDDGTCTVVFCRGVDLIRAYDDFGHRLFAPNVRCYLQDTPVNSRIQEAVKTAKGIANFRYMNNGVTIIGEAIDKKASPKLRIRKPGVVNGLQTIRALSQAYGDLDASMRALFEEKLYILVRIFAGKKQSFSTDDLIVATNNQNKMEARNLRSNTGTQKHIEQSFAKLWWFYERKEKAWEAFSESAGSWDTLKGLKASNFGGNAKANRRNVDNEVVAASWLAFSGYSDIARNEKNKLFSDDKRYERIFELVPAKHGFDYDYKRDGPTEDQNSSSSIPPASSMLLATLLYSSAKYCASSAAETKRKFIQQHALTDMGTDEQNAKLAAVPEYLAELMMVSSPFLFTELFGYLFYQIPQEDRDKAGRKILEETDIATVFKSKNYLELKQQLWNAPEKHHFFSGCYQMWGSILAEFSESEAFRTDLLNASSRPSFVHNGPTRRKLIGRIKEYDRSIERRGSLDKVWSEPFDSAGSVSQSLHEFCLSV